MNQSTTITAQPLGEESGDDSQTHHLGHHREITEGSAQTYRQHPHNQQQYLGAAPVRQAQQVRPSPGKTQDPWYFLLLPGAVTLLGGCAGMSLSANWPIRWRAVSSIAGATLFGLLAGGATVLLQGPAHEKVLTLLGGHLPSLGVALFCGAGLGVVLGTTFAVLNIVFSAKMVPMSIAAALSQGLVPVLAAAVPIYVLGRLIVGQGPSMNLAALF